MARIVLYNGKFPFIDGVPSFISNEKFVECCCPEPPDPCGPASVTVTAYSLIGHMYVTSAQGPCSGPVRFDWEYALGDDAELEFQGQFLDDSEEPYCLWSWHGDIELSYVQYEEVYDSEAGEYVQGPEIASGTIDDQEWDFVIRGTDLVGGSPTSFTFSANLGPNMTRATILGAYSHGLVCNSNIEWTSHSATVSAS